MLLAHLLPFLDAEIDRLQQARDLLAYSPPAEQATVAMDLPSVDLLATPELNAPEARLTLAIEPQSAASPALAPPRVIVLKPHGPGRGGRYGRRRTAPASDTALRSSVPVGPIVVSAEEVRRRAQAGMAAPPASIAPTFTWQPPARSKGDVDALLQKLMDLGTQDESVGVHPAGLG